MKKKGEKEKNGEKKSNEERRIEAQWRQKKRREHTQRDSESHFIAIL